jgi:glycerophosphoryl diester phosphodiesterase
VREYFDGQLMIYSDMVTEHATGNVGIQTNYGTAQWDNLRISLMTDPIPAPQTSTAEPKTLSPNLVNPPTVVANQAADLAQVTALSDDDVTTSLLADLSLAEGKLVVSSQGNHLGELLEVLAAAPQLVQVVLRIEDQPTAQAFIATVNDGLEDQHVTSSDPNITKLIRQATTAHPVRASLLTNQTPTTVAEGLDLVKQANIGWTKNIILTGSIPSKTVIEQMQRRLASVWVTATDSLLSATQAITSGANGIVTSTPATVQSAAAVFTTPTLTRRPFVIAHRGTPGAAPYGGAAPENTMLSYRKSVEDFGADMIETDIYVTKDDAVILLHDDTFARTTDIQTTTALTDAEVAATGRTRAQLRPIDLTLEQIKRLNAGQGEPIPTLDELLDYMVGKDVVLFLESKDLISDDIERRCVEVLNAHPAVKDQVTIISFNERSLSRYTELAPEMSLGFLIGESLSTNPQAAMATILGHTQKFNATYNPSSGPINNTIVKHLSARGITIWPWTINSASGWANFINMGVGGITTDLSGYAKDSAFVIQPNLAANHLEIGQSTDLAVTATTHIGGQLDLASEALVIDGGEHIAIANNQITGVSRGVAHLLLRAQHPAGSGGAYTSYALYTEPITVTVGDNSNSVLGLAVETYGKVIQRRADYTPSSFAAFQLAYDRAVALLERGDFSTAEQSAAIAELQQAFAGLELAPALGPLQALIAHAEAILEHPEGFMQSSLADLRTALTAAQTALANPALTNLEALSTALALQQAIAAVTAKGDTSALLALVDLVDRLVASAFTPATWNPVQTARQAAQPVIDLAEASELAVQLAYDRLYQAVSDLALRANHSGLTSAITIAQLILADQTAYLPSSIVGLAEALTHAETVNADGNATQAEVDAAQQALLELVVKARLRPTGTSPIVANGQGLTQTVSKVSAVIKTNLSAKAKPQIVGQAKVGTRLRAKTTWSAGQTVKTSYRWYRNGKAIRGAVAQSYRLGQADKGKRITVRVTGRAPNGAKVTVASRASSKVRG